jgi:hypothetical protein
VTRTRGPEAPLAIGSETNRDEITTWVAAAERMLSHALIWGDPFTLEEAAEHALVLLGRAQQFLAVAV